MKIEVRKKVGNKVGIDDSVKQFSLQPPYISISFIITQWKSYVGWGFRFYAAIPTLLSWIFAIQLTLHHFTYSNVVVFT